MEEWQLDFKWLEIRHYVKKTLSRTELPDLQGILFMIGIQELGRWQEKFTKEEKQDLMHIAVCRLLSIDGFYEFEGRDADGWPHWKALRGFSMTGVKDQESLLKEKIIQYFAAEKEQSN